MFAAPGLEIRRKKTVIFLLTLALRDTCGTIEISGGVPRAGNTVVLPELCLISPHRAADTPVYCGVIVMAWRALNCRAGRKTLIECERFHRLTGFSEQARWINEILEQTEHLTNSCSTSVNNIYYFLLLILY